MLVVTTPNIEGKRVTQYLGLVTGETILGANIMRDFMASITDIIGGRSTAYEESLKEAKRIATEEMIAEAQRLGANAILSVDLDFETVGQGSMLMVSLSGTAVVIE
ncbi:MAG: YbjQ family protein [Chloroflexota bacterium]|jgi:uncharacterized protein YbjQ (UPF0145 family)|nr:YbjQ family protein [Chloroflexota bacterium]